MKMNDLKKIFAGAPITRNADLAAKFSRIDEAVRADIIQRKHAEKKCRTLQAELTAAREALEEARMQYAQAEKTPREPEARVLRLLEALPGYHYSVAVDRNGPVSTTHGRGCTAITGYTPAEYAADPFLWYRMVHEEDRSSMVRFFNALLSGSSFWSLDHRIRHKNGSIRWIRNRVVPSADAQGILVGFDGLITDITEQRHLEEQLRQSRKMEAIGTLTSGIFHDFNNILMAIMGHAELLRMKMDADDPRIKHVSSLSNLVDRAGDLTGRLLAFTRKESVTLKAVRLNDLVRRLEQLLPPLLGERIALRRHLFRGELTVMADEGQIEQVFMNLVTNARDAMPDGGELSIETALFDLDAAFQGRHGYGVAGRYALVAVVDTGVGIPKEIRERIFEPFFTTKEPGKGTGLGLSIVYNIIKQHNGFINCYSEPGNGTVFRVYLPLAEAAAEEERTERQTRAITGTEQVLVADDDHDTRRIMVQALESFGYQVIEACDGDDAVRKFLDQVDSVQCLVLDVAMPGKNGKQAYDEMSLVHPDLPVIFTSGYTADGARKRGIPVDEHPLLSKPVSPTVLAKAVREVLDAACRSKT
jgi:two-component system cell cycle sensor histidine kinase/response regulator CckA